jgi:threonine/homoserine/homoserine lactone efflux protein
MPTTPSLAAFTALAVALIAVPGPSVMFVVGRALALGRRAALITVVGNATGFYVQVMLVAIGLGAIVERSVALFSAIKLIGAGYLVWLGIQAFRHRAQLSDTLADIDTRPRHRSLFRDGFVVGVANPKTTLFFAAILPQYVTADGAPPQAQVLVLGLVFVLIALVLDSAWGLAAGTARAWFAGSPRNLGRLGAIGGAAKIGLGINHAVTQRPN